MKRGSIFELNGIPKFQEALPLALQHVVAMIVGCVTPAIIVAGVAGLSEQDSVILIQAALTMIAGVTHPTIMATTCCRASGRVSPTDVFPSTLNSSSDILFVILLILPPNGFLLSCGLLYYLQIVLYLYI